MSKILCFKDEFGGVGIVTIYDNESLIGAIIPYGGPYPVGIKKLRKFKTLRAAKQMAKKIGAEFRSF